MLPVWVQFFRNLFCVLKSLVPKNHAIQKTFLPFYFSVGPIASTTIIESLIGLSQLGAVVFNSTAGVKNIYNGFKDLIWARNFRSQYVSRIKQVSFPDLKETIIIQDLNNYINTLIHKIIGGFGDLIVGIAFLFLFLNSFHIHFETHPKPLIDALIWMEIALVYFLYIMFQQCFNSKSQSLKLEELSNNLRNRSISITDEISFCDSVKALGYENHLMDALMIMDTNYKPVYRGDKVKEKDTKKLMKDTYSQLNKTLKQFYIDEFDDCNKDKIKKNGKEEDKDDTNKEKESKRVYLNYDNAATNCTKVADEFLSKLSLQIIYFLLNGVAWYGYLLGILAFYTPNELVILKFGYPDDVADWWGNFIGDLAWTIEPLIILWSAGALAFGQTVPQQLKKVAKRSSAKKAAVVTKKTSKVTKKKKN